MDTHFDIIAHVMSLPKTSPTMIHVFSEFLRRESHVKETADSIEQLRRISVERYILEQRAWNSFRGIHR